MPRPFRFGIVSGDIISRTEWVTKVRKAEDLGYATLSVPDHVTGAIAPLTALGVAAGVTRSLRLGSFVFNNDYRHPAVLAKEIATLDVLSEGRFEIGIGAGFLDRNYSQTGIALDPVSTRIRRLEEAIQVMKQLFTEDAVNFSGSFYTITEMNNQPKPLQKPYPPFLIGGAGKQVLSLAGRQADSVNFGALENLETIAQKISWVRDAAGERFKQIELGFPTFQVNITRGTGSVVEQGKSVSDSRVTRAPIFAPPAFQILTGSIDQITEELLSRREQFGFSYVQVQDTDMEAFAPIVARLTGK